MPLVFAAIAPHGGLAVEEWCDPDEREVARLTRQGFEALGRRFLAARPDATIVATPHHVHVEGALAVIVGAELSGALEDSFSPVELACPIDLELSFEVLAALGERVPAVGVGFGSNDPESATVPMDWGTLIPLWFLGGRADPPLPVVVVCPSRDLSLERHAEAGRALAAAAAASTAASPSSRAPITATPTIRTARTASIPPRPSSTRPSSRLYVAISSSGSWISKTISSSGQKRTARGS